jgi:hypothetical protein
LGSGFAFGKLGDAVDPRFGGRFHFGFLLNPRYQVNLAFAFSEFRAPGHLVFGDPRSPEDLFPGDNVSSLAFGAEFEWHFFPMKHFDPTLRAGYNVISYDYELDSEWGYYTRGFAFGHGPDVGLNLDLVIPFMSSDLIFGIDTYAVLNILRDIAGNNFDGVTLMINGKMGFRF